MIVMLISGGQTGADRAALDFAVENYIQNFGWCPKGRLAEDGPISPCYQLTETASDKYPPRTEKNVKFAEGTIIFNHSKVIERGCALTQRYCEKHAKPCLVLTGIESSNEVPQARLIEEFVKRFNIRLLNVAGNRESKAKGIYRHVKKVLQTLPREIFVRVEPSLADKLNIS